MRLSHKVVLASLNRNKFEEFQLLFRNNQSDIELVPADRLLRNPRGLALVENQNTYFENAIAKARLANQGSHYPSLADDSGLEVEGLAGKPGVKSHRYAPPKPHVSQDQANVELLLKELGAGKSRNAKFVCSLALVIEGLLIHSTGIIEGKIAEAPRGTAGFGYDSVFIPNGSSKTFAEMSQSEKNAISHRALAVKNLLTEVQTHGIVFVKP